MKNNICPNCGVELDLGLSTCPLCGKAGTESIDISSKETANYPSEILHMEAKARRRYTWELTGIVAASAILISLIVDLVVSKGLSWSLVCTILIAGAWIYITLFTFSNTRKWILVPGLMLNSLLIPFTVDMVYLPVNWFLPLALPVTISFFILLYIILILIKRANYKGFNILAIVFIGASIQCIIFELFIDLYIKGNIQIDWSAITVSTIIPFSGILMFIHYRLKRGLNLKSYFHV